jgi:hypothetical protein
MDTKSENPTSEDQRKMFIVLDFKDTMGGLAVVIMLAAYIVQLWKTYEGKSEPHPIAWFGFGLLTGVGYLVQWQKGAGAGSWVMGVTAIFCFLVGGMSQYKRRWKVGDFDFWDWVALGAGGGLFALYLMSRNLSWGPLVSAVLATAADLVLYIPIFKKAWMLPEKENRTSYGLNSLKFVPSFFAMDSYSWETCLYPGALVAMNAIVVAYLSWRRQQLHVPNA